MENEVKEKREKESNVQVRPETHFVPGLPQEQWIFQNMQYNHQPNSDRNRLSFEDLPGLYDMSCTQLLALANTIPTSSSIGAALNSNYGADSQIPMDYWVNNCNMESNPWVLNPGSSHGQNNTNIVGETTMPNPQYDGSTSRKFICDLNLPPEEMINTEPEYSPITLDTPGKGLLAIDMNPQETIKKSVFEIGSSSGENQRKRGRDDDNNKAARLKTPRLKQKRRKIRPKVIKEGNTRKATSKTPVKRASAAARTSEACGYSRPKRSIKKSIRFDNYGEKEEEYCGVTIAPDGQYVIAIDGKIKSTETLEMFHNIPKRRRQRRTRPKREITLQVGLNITSNERRDLEGNVSSIKHDVPDKLKAIVPRKKRSKRDTIASPRQCGLQTSQGLSLDNTREHKASIDMNGALVLHKKTSREQKALVPYKKEKHRPKVKLDNETKRVWKLLKENIDSEGVDGSDDNKRKWWEEERKLFKDRAEKFISRMLLVQGDRTFSPWKGSVVDSVVGVYLTQGVTDHSSSSVFMELAAEFPPIHLNSEEGSCFEEYGSSVTHETTMNLNPRNEIAAPRTHGPNSIIIHEIDDDDDDDIDAVCSKEISKTSDNSISLDPPKNNFETQADPEARETIDCDEQERETYDPIYDPKMSKKKPNKSFDWDSLRRKAESGGKKRERTERTMDTVDYDALRCSDVSKIAALLRKRGVQNVLASRIKAFLNRLVQDHGEVDLEWLRDVPPDKAKEYLLSFEGLGLKSVECVRLLSLHQKAFPVDTNVGRIVVRLGWVPIQPLPDELQMHLLEMYPMLNSVQKYLWPRLCKLDQKTLYELHYHMITFGKVFCTKSKPNCNACPMKNDCKHYASAHASARLALPKPEEKTTAITEYNPKHAMVKFRQSLFTSQDKEQEVERTQNREPIIEEPASPEPLRDIEDYPWDNNNKFSKIFEGGIPKDPWESDVIPTLVLHNEAGTSKDLIVLSPQATSRPARKLKTVGKLRTEHYAYEIPDSHPILEGFAKREPDDKFPYLLAIWTPGETSSSIEPPRKHCLSQESNTLCRDKTCFSCNSVREEQSQTVRGTIMIPCRTAMRGSFPLNGTYFQTNEVFADHHTSINPIHVPRQSIWNLNRETIFFGSSVSICFVGSDVETIKYCFRRGYVCVRGFDRKSRKPKDLVKRLHCSPSNKKQKDKE